ncbi:DUF5678 domain-containing protein [Parabacteroides distasonis]|uniref:DUF5678 domain-containing protein n=1 Tax=Parabacteroides distasonis TaxID=823 RepID=A0A6I2P372_PARDI|nr:DUF5678 domain-containing protein [Parabacteroides distasonis]MRY85106.1 hypothetical protein [Parabacteroides distasonis]MRZ06726.1 hypothetical protein [Parabacteroides distasonis]
MASLEALFKFYLANQTELVKLYNGKHIVLVGNQVVGAFDTMEQAYNYAESKYELGTFLIQLCTPGDEAYTQTFHSRVVFA